MIIADRLTAVIFVPTATIATRKFTKPITILTERTSARIVLKNSMKELLHNIINKMIKGNFSFLILIVGVLQLIEMRKKK